MNALAYATASRQLQSALRVAERAHRAALCAARQVRRRRRGGQSQYRGVSDHRFWTAWPAKPAASEVVAHATLSLSQPETVVVGCVRRGGIERVQIRVVIIGRRAVDCAARNSRAQGAPRFLDSAPPALRAADGLDRASRDPFLGNYRRPARKCLTTVGGGATVGSSSPAAARSPLHIARCGARSNRRSQATVRSPLLKPLPGCLFVRRHVRETDNRIGLRFGPRPGADPTVHHTSNHHAATAVRLSEVDASGDALSAPIHREQQRHRRSEWAGVSWPKDDDARTGRGRRQLGSRSREGQRTQHQRRGRVASRVRSRPGAAGRTRVLRAGTEAAIANDSMRCKT